ncbi:MAG: aminoglycoside phosphotransferase [Pyrinomonadaceae bacterium]|nr:aminoglycoside phosphotransferase [Pyrinomonadaceae bacterium]
MIGLPQEFCDATISREGDSGRVWLRQLPDRIEALKNRWNLVQDGELMHGYLAVVVPVLRKGEQLALKVSWIDRYSEQEALALKSWGGIGAVSLFESDTSEGAMLVERLDSSKTLETIPPERAIRIAGGLLRKLAIRAPREITTVSSEVDQIAVELPQDWNELGKPFEKSILDKAMGLLPELRVSNASLLVNHDLHYGNVLAGKREPWIVIDPKVFAGDPEFALAQLIWQEFAAVNTDQDLDRVLGILIDEAELDAELSRKWLFVRVVSNRLWSLKEGFTRDAERCRKLAEWL